MKKILLAVLTVAPNLITMVVMLLPLLLAAAAVSFLTAWVLVPMFLYIVYTKHTFRKAPIDPKLGVRVLLASGVASKITGGYYATFGAIFVPNKEFLYGDALLQHEVFHAKDRSTTVLEMLGAATAFSAVLVGPVTGLVVGVIYASYSRRIEERADAYAFQHGEFIPDRLEGLAKHSLPLERAPKLDKLFQLHPDITERMELYREALPSEGPESIPARIEGLF